MTRLGPQFFDGEAIVEGVVALDPQGRVVAVEEGATGPLDHRGLVVPAPTNAHTHLADRLARERVRGAALPLAEAVAPPDGLKHRLLRAASREQLQKSLAGALAEARAAGTARVLDFREGGPRGARLLRAAAAESQVEAVVLGRPSRAETWGQEQGALEGLVDGLGISGLEDQPWSLTQDEARWCHERDLQVALHVSEGRPEDVAAALSLQPDLLVHLTHASPAEIEAVAASGASVALCPRSNALFGGRPPLEAIVAACPVVGLGTDNAMFHRVDVWQEVAYVAREWPVLDPATLLSLACSFHLPGEPTPTLAPDAPACLLDVSKGLRRGLTHPNIHPGGSLP